MSSLEDRQNEMRQRFASGLSLKINLAGKPWENYAANMATSRCESCSTPFITMGSNICGQCQARKKEFSSILRLLA